MARIRYDAPDGVETVTVDAEKVSESAKVRGVRIQREDGSYLHVPDARLYAVEMTEEEGKVDYDEP